MKKTNTANIVLRLCKNAYGDIIEGNPLGLWVRRIRAVWKGGESTVTITTGVLGAQRSLHKTPISLRLE